MEQDLISLSADGGDDSQLDLATYAQRAYLEYAAAKGVEWYVVDSEEEIRKVQSVKADAKLYLRIDAPNKCAVTYLLFSGLSFLHIRRNQTIFKLLLSECKNALLDGRITIRGTC